MPRTSALRIVATVEPPESPPEPVYTWHRLEASTQGVRVQISRAEPFPRVEADVYYLDIRREREGGAVVPVSLDEITPDELLALHTALGRAIEEARTRGILPAT